MGRNPTSRIGTVVIVGAAVLAALPCVSAQARPTGEPLAVEATALVPVDAESAVSIVGIKGQISVSNISERELRVLSRTTGDSGAELPVGIWQDGAKLILAPAPGDKGAARKLHVEVPTGFAVAVEAADSEVIVMQSAGGGVELKGTKLRASVQAVGGSVNAEVVGGTLAVRDAKDATVTSRDTAITMGNVSGSVVAHTVGGSVGLTSIAGPADIESDGTKLVFEGMSSSVRVKAQNGDAKFVRLAAGGELAMVETPLHLLQGNGEINVTSDGAVDFESMAATLHFEMYGGSVRGKGNDGILEIRPRNTEVNVEAITGGVRVQGDGVTAHIVDVGGELFIETTSSEIVVDRVASVVLKVDRGNVTIQRATGAVSATVVGGDVHILDVSGTVTLDLDRGEGEVSYASISGDKDSQLVNRSGGLTVRFPGSGACRVEAKSKSGRIDSDLPTVRVMDDLKEAQGAVNNGYRPVIHVNADGDIQLQDSSTPSAP